MRAPPFLPDVHDMHVEMMTGHPVPTHTQTDSTTSILISSNVHFVHLGGDKNYRTQRHLLCVACLSCKLMLCYLGVYRNFHASLSYCKSYVS